VDNALVAGAKPYDLTVAADLLSLHAPAYGGWCQTCLDAGGRLVPYPCEQLKWAAKIRADHADLPLSRHRPSISPDCQGQGMASGDAVPHEHAPARVGAGSAGSQPPDQRRVVHLVHRLAITLATAVSAGLTGPVDVSRPRSR
jgi:hypothetical protein